jgi:hypothetical protein
MPAAALEGDALAAQLAPLATPASAHRRAGIVVCSQARDRAEAIELLDMLGLRNPPPAAAPPPPPTPRRRATVPAPTNDRQTASLPADRPADAPVEAPTVAAPAPLTNPATSAETATAPRTQAASAPTRSTPPSPRPATARPMAWSRSAEKPAGSHPHRPRAAATHAATTRAATVAAPPPTAASASARWTDVAVAAAHGVVIDCSASGVPAVGTCQGPDCGRPMVSVRAYRKDDCWRENGFVYHDAHGLCHRCYMAKRYRQNQLVQAAVPQDSTAVVAAASAVDIAVDIAVDEPANSPTNSVVNSGADGPSEAPTDAIRTVFPASAVVVAPLYPVLCTECGVVGDTTPSNPQAAEQLREQHVQDHQRHDRLGRGDHGQTGLALLGKATATVDRRSA